MALSINQDQAMSLLRTVLKIAGTAVVAHGTLGINGAMWEQIAWAIIMLGPVVWDMFTHTDSAAIAKVTAMPDVAKITIAVPPLGTAGEPSAAVVAAADPTQTKVST